MPRILYVEDNDDNIYMIRSRLQRQGFEVLIARDGASGVEIARCERPGCILRARARVTRAPDRAWYYLLYTCPCHVIVTASFCFAGHQRHCERELQHGRKRSCREQFIRTRLPERPSAFRKRLVCVECRGWAQSGPPMTKRSLRP